MKKPIRLGIVDDHPGVRFAIRVLLASAKDITVVGEGGNGLEAIQLANKQNPDVLLLDAEMPIMKGSEVVQQIREIKPNIKILALSSYSDPMYILGMLENGAAGYLTKDEAPSMLLLAIRSVIHDQVKWISPNIADQVSNIQLENKTFTGRELEILRYIALGNSDEEIAQHLGIDEKLLARYLDLLMDKFDVTSREKLTDAAYSVISTTPA